MQVDVLIIGQGICGTMLSWFLQKEGRSFLLLDESSEHTASKVAAGLINPVTGRRYVTSWMAAELMDFAGIAYGELGSFLQTNLLEAKSIIDFFPSAQMRNAFVDHISENDTYVHAYPDQNLFNPFFQYEFGCGEIRPAYTVQMQVLLSKWQQNLQAKQRLREETFVHEDLMVEEDGIRYHDVSAQKIIFCDGIAAAASPWFSLLPFSANKGEALIIECAALSREHIYKKGMMLMPVGNEQRFWLGSNYLWEFEDEEPSEKFFAAASALLKQWVKSPYKILEHKAAIRPATLERRPFVGFHPIYPSVGILNGMGTKGASLAPFFANQLVQHLVHNLPLAPEADVHRFQRILSK